MTAHPEPTDALAAANQTAVSLSRLAITKPAAFVEALRTLPREAVCTDFTAGSSKDDGALSLIVEFHSPKPPNAGRGAMAAFLDGILGMLEIRFPQVMLPDIIAGNLTMAAYADPEAFRLLAFDPESGNPTPEATRVPWTIPHYLASLLTVQVFVMMSCYKPDEPPTAAYFGARKAVDHTCESIFTELFRDTQMVEKGRAMVVGRFPESIRENLLAQAACDAAIRVLAKPPIPGDDRVPPEVARVLQMLGIDPADAQVVTVREAADFIEQRNRRNDH